MLVHVVVGDNGPLETNMSRIPQTCPGQMAAAMNVWTDVDVGSPTFVTRLTEAMDDLLEQLWLMGLLNGCMPDRYGRLNVICAGAEFEERDLGLTPTCNYEPTFSGVWGCEFDPTEEYYYARSQLTVPRGLMKVRWFWS